MGATGDAATDLPAAFEAYRTIQQQLRVNLAAPVRVDDGVAEIDVLDAGAGVAAVDVERLKQPFVRGDQARGGAMGAGLGLALVERLTQWHGGSFDLLPRAGGGTIARIRLPLV